jgi:hypothetical protein
MNIIRIGTRNTFSTATTPISDATPPARLWSLHGELWRERELLEHRLSEIQADARLLAEAIWKAEHGDTPMPPDYDPDPIPF